MVKKLLIINKESLDSIGSKQLAVVYLKHPRTQKPMPFLAVETTDNQMLIYELKSYTPDLSSVFIDDYVQMDAFVYLAAEFNINYFLIDFLKDLNCKNQQFKNIDEFKKMFLSNLISDSIDQKQFENMLEKIVITEERLNKLFKINQSQK